MKTKLGFFAVLAIFCTITVFSQNKEYRSLKNFSKIDVWGNIKIELQKGDSNTVFINAGSVPLDEIVTEIKDSVLKIRMRSNLFKDVIINLKVSYKEIIDIKANASAELKFLDKIILENVKLECISGARVVLKADLKNCDLSAYQGGQIDIKGTSGYSSILANSGGMISGADFIVDEANIKLNTSGKCELTVTKKIVARVNTKSSLSYFGKPEVEEIKTSLGGIVSKWDE